MEGSSISRSDYKAPISKKEYREKSIKIATYLITLKKLREISLTKFWKFKKEALKYRVYRQKL